MSRYVYYEDYQIGTQFVTPGRTIGETEVSMFAMLTGDFNRLHTDAEYMKTSVFGERIAHGLLGLAMVKKSSLLSNKVPETVLALTLQIFETGALMVQLYTFGVSATLFNKVVQVASLSVV